METSKNNLRAKEYILHKADMEDNVTLNIMQRAGISFVAIVFYKYDMANPILCDLSVEKDFQGAGYGKDIMEYAEETCKEYCSFERCPLESISLLVHNMDWRHDWFKRAGYEDDFHDTQLYMRKKIE